MWVCCCWLLCCGCLGNSERLGSRYRSATSWFQTRRGRCAICFFYLPSAGGSVLASARGGLEEASSSSKRHALFSETRMRGAKQLSFCGAVAGAQLFGVKCLDGVTPPQMSFIIRLSKIKTPKGLGIPRAKRVREADALAGVRVPTRLPLAVAPDAGDHMPPRL